MTYVFANSRRDSCCDYVTAADNVIMTGGVVVNNFLILQGCAIAHDIRASIGSVILIVFTASIFITP
jgi:hypothetical protein